MTRCDESKADRPRTSTLPSALGRVCLIFNQEKRRPVKQPTTSFSGSPCRNFDSLRAGVFQINSSFDFIDPVHAVCGQHQGTDRDRTHKSAHARECPYRQAEEALQREQHPCPAATYSERDEKEKSVDPNASISPELCRDLISGFRYGARDRNCCHLVFPQDTMPCSSPLKAKDITVK